MSSELYLGSCVYEPRPHARVQPCAVAERGVWQVYDDWSKALPNEGRAFAPDLAGFHMDELLAFGVEPNPRPTLDKDLYIVRDPQRVEEILDFRSVDQEIARRALVEHGLPTVPLGATRIVAALNDASCVVVPIERDPITGRHVAKISGLEQTPVHALNASTFDGPKFRGRHLTVPGVTVGVPLGTINWCRDADFLEVVLKRLRKLVPTTAASTVARANIAPLIAYLSQASLLPSTAGDLASIRDRLKGFSSEFGQGVETLNELVETLRALEPVDRELRTQLEARRGAIEAELRAELEPKVTADIERELAPLSRRRDELQADVDLLRRQAEELSSEAGQIRETTGVLRAVLRDELAGLDTVFTDVEPNGAEFAAALRERISAEIEARGHSAALLPSAAAPWTRTSARSDAAALDWDVAAEALEQAAVGCGFLGEDLLLADVTARAGALVVLPEGDAARFLGCYAQVVASGEVWRHDLDPSVLSVSDLWRNPATGKPTAFAEAWTAALRDERRYRIVLLAGIQRTPADLWLPGLVDALVERPSNLLAFASIDDRWMDPARRWPPLSSAGVAVMPTKRGGLNQSVLAAGADGVRAATTCLDAERPPSPTRLEVRDFVDTCGADEASDALRRMVGAFRAAWPHRESIDPASVAKLFAKFPEGADESLRDVMTRGTEWLQNLMQSSAEE